MATTRSVPQYVWWGVLVLGVILLLSASHALLAGSTEKEKNDLALELATLFRAGRKVISDNQDLINDASKGDKGLSAEKVISLAKENFQKVSGRPPSTDNTSPAGKAGAAMLGAMKEVMTEAQTIINEPAMMSGLT